MDKRGKHFTRDTRKANKNMKTCSSSSVMEMQIETTMTYHHKPITKAKILKQY